MRILFITATRLGDAILSTGLLSHLIDLHPGARITIAAGPAAAPIFRSVPGVERVICVRKERYGGHWLKLWRACAGRRWHVVVDLRRSLIGWVLLASNRYTIPKINSPVHRVELLGATVGLREAPPTPKVWITDTDMAAAAEIIPHGPPVLAVAPAANWRGKQWRVERFCDLATRLTAADGILPGARIAVFAAANERPQIEPVMVAFPANRLIDTVGRIDLPLIAACLKRCALFVGNDSGLMHMAAACGIPTLGLFGPSREAQYAPWGSCTASVRTIESYEDLTGGPDYDHRTTGTLMDGLSVDQAERAAVALWRRCGNGQS